MLDETESVPEISSPTIESRVSGGLAALGSALFGTWQGAVGSTLVAILFLLAVLGPVLAPYSPNAQSLPLQLQPPNSHNWLGTDGFGRDILSRILAGTRYAILIGALADAVAVILGSAFGLAAAFYGRAADAILMRIMDVLLAFPYLLLAMLIIVILGPGLFPAVVAIGIVYVPQFARLSRSAALAVRSEEYIQAARALGAGRLHIIVHHALSNVAPPIIAQGTLMFGIAILEVAGLGFLGLGAQPPTPEWGSMLADGRTYLLTNWWVGAFPALAIMISVLGFNLLGDRLRDLADPRTLKR